MSGEDVVGFAAPARATPLGKNLPETRCGSRTSGGCILAKRQPRWGGAGTVAPHPDASASGATTQSVPSQNVVKYRN